MSTETEIEQAETVATDESSTPAAAPEQVAVAEQPAKKPRAPRAQSTAKKTRTVELTLTVTGTAEGEWQAELSQAGKRVLQGLSVPAAAVSRAAAELHEDISKAIETVIDAAREQHRARMEELEAELSKVKAALADLQEG
ncbi:polyhydroxyalkanoate synthesis regulator phasin [Actinokineospora baliensis]|uniref:DUF6319 family protein n=1 Tax=Actinokineospora baliensis TaxID=547056 RepID=UPI0019567892|nr:DUF6319 family protein [Actinokineospora baliensis]MBM7775131.1 polyhydroxyalkanoate synthesis regulator phasin [Actinokineospora baliensis]